MTPFLILAVVGVFVFVGVGTARAMTWWLVRNAPERRRLRSLGSGGASVLPVRRRELKETVDPALAKLSRLLPKSPKELSRLRRRLTQAGYPQMSASVIYSVAEIVLPLACALVVIALAGVRSGLMVAGFVAVMGYVAPSFYVGHKAKLRKKLIRNGLPDALDLLTLCTEAGSGLDQALLKTSDELTVAHPVLAGELRLITTEVRAGKARMEALKNFAARTGVEDVQNLVTMLIQTDRFGTNVADALRTQSDESRTKRRQEAEERAGKVGVKLVFPLVLCLFPALYVVCFGPVVVKIYRAFFEHALT